MNLKKSLILSLILIVSVSVSAFLIWQGLNIDIKEEKSEVLGTLNSAQQVFSQPSPSTQSFAQVLHKIVKVIDGDTIHAEINGKSASIRLIGIDTPETVDPRKAVGCFGKKASDETKRLLEGKSVILTKDVSETDKYNRLLRYVFLPLGEGESLFINDYLIRQGFAKILTYPPDIKYDARFLQAEKEARENLRGLWGECK